MVKRLQQGVVFIAFISLATISHAEESGQCKNWVAKAAAVVGKIDAKRHGQQDWQPVKRNNTYCPGDQIRAAKASSATLVFTNETLVTLDQLTAITINQIDNDGPSILELVKGIAHFISRVPRSLKVNTPFVNAAIEGTEFVVEVGENETTVTVFEGTVLTANDQGELRVTNNETSKTIKGEAPQKILLARPRDAVQWALYFPPIIKSDVQGSNIEQASALLYSGLADEAKALIADDESGEAKALLAIIAIVNNQGNALELASEALKRSPDAAASHIALSYAWQSRFDLTNAMTSAAMATQKEPNNAIAWARLAELQLSVGRLSRALDSATKASEIDPTLARTQTILGFAYLTRIQINQAKDTFNKAIELDQSDPLPHLGLGLAMIRKNELAEGRREIEIAAALDPNNSIIRSYLGKAYFEEKRAPLDAEQFAMAKELDPNDPTPHLYNAIRRQTENDPVGALKDINKSIELNDNRAVFRSSLQLDQDEAARSTNLSSIYNQLGFNQLGQFEAHKSINSNPNNHATHRLLADIYFNQPRHEIARTSNILQSQLLQPINLNFVLPQEKETNLSGTHYLSLSSTVDNYDNLFTSEKFILNGHFMAGGNQTNSGALNFGTLEDNSMFNAGVFTYSTNGFRPNNDRKLTIANMFTQFDYSHSGSFQFEIQQKSDTFGDLTLRFDPNNFVNNSTTTNNDKSLRLGFRNNLSQHLLFLASGIVGQTDESRTIGPLSTNTHSNINNVEAQLRYTTFPNHLVFGLGNYNRDANREVTIFGFPQPSTKFNVQHTNGYLYYTHNFNSLGITAGLSHDDLDGQIVDRNSTNPKLGFTWDITDNSTLQAAAFRTLKRSLFTSQTIEPTLVSGFNQLYDDPAGTIADRYGISYDYKFKNNFLGFEISKRELDVPYSSVSGGITTVLQTDWSEQLSRFYWNIILMDWLSTSIEYQFEIMKRSDEFSATDYFLDVKTKRLPITFNSQITQIFDISLKTTYVDQQGTFEDIATGNNTPGNDNFWVVDFKVRSFFPKRSGSIEFGVQNLLNEKFNYQDTNPKNPLISPEIFFFGRLNYKI